MAASSSADLAAEGEGEGEAEEAAAALMQSVQRGFAAAKRAGVPAATRLVKELKSVCAGDAGIEVCERQAPLSPLGASPLSLSTLAAHRFAS